MLAGGVAAFATGGVTVRDIHGHPRAVPEPGSKATVLIFVTQDCPISNSYVPEINRITGDYSSRDIAFLIVYVDATVTLATVKKHAEEYGYRAPAVFDARHVLVERVKATVTPEAAVLDSQGQILYRGRIDDLYPEIGKRRSEPTEHDLRDALDAILSGKPVLHPTTKAVGCFISSTP